MKNIWKLHFARAMYLVAVSLLLTGCGNGETSVNIAAATNIKTPANVSELLESSAAEGESGFHTIYPLLDQKADLVLYWNPTQVMDKLNAQIDDIPSLSNQLAAQFNIPESDMAEIEPIFDLVAGFIQTFGITELRGIGVSSLSLEKDLNRHKFVLQRSARLQSDNPDNSLWSLFGNPIAIDDHLNKFPASTVVGNSGHIELGKLLKISKSLIEKHAPDDVSDVWGENLESLDNQFNLSQLLQGLEGGFHFAIMMDLDNKIPFPTPKGAIMIPQTSIALSVNTLDDSLFKFFSKTFADAEFLPVDVEDGDGFHLKFPFPMALDLRPSFIQSGDRFVIASNPDDAMAMLNPSESEVGSFATSDEAAKWSNRFNTKANSITFIANNFGTAVKGAVDSYLELTDDIPQEMAPLISSISESWENPQYFGISHMGENGLYAETYSSISSSQTMMAAPAAIVGAIVVPAFAQGKKSSVESVACMNHLKQIGLAARMYQTDNNESFPQNPEDLIPYLGGTKAASVFFCPGDPDYTEKSEMNFEDSNWKKMISYRFSMDKVKSSDADPDTVIATCPVHGHKCHYDGSVRK